MTYYVYALCLEKEEIAASLSFQEKRTAIRAYKYALHEMEQKYSTDGFHFGCIEVVPKKKVRITYELPSRHEDRKGWKTEKVFDIDDFIAVESLTKKILMDNMRQCTIRCNVWASMHVPHPVLFATESVSFSCLFAFLRSVPLVPSGD